MLTWMVWLESVGSPIRFYQLDHSCYSDHCSQASSWNWSHKITKAMLIANISWQPYSSKVAGKLFMKRNEEEWSWGKKKRKRKETFHFLFRWEGIAWESWSLFSMTETKKMNIFSYLWLMCLRTNFYMETSKMLVNSNHKLTNKGKCSYL